MKIFLAIIIGFMIGMVADAIFICEADRDMWWRNSIYDNSIYKQIDEYKESKEYKIFKFEKDLNK